MHKEQIMPLQAMDSLISIMESYKKEQKIKSPWKNIGKNISFITCYRKQNLA